MEKYAPQTQRGTAEEFMGILDTYEISNIRTLGYDTSKLRMVPQAAANAAPP